MQFEYNRNEHRRLREIGAKKPKWSRQSPDIFQGIEIKLKLWNPQTEWLIDLILILFLLLILSII